MPSRVRVNVIGLWLAWQLIAALAAPVALVRSPAPASRDCRCPHAVAIQCPMHEPSRGRAVCILRNARGDDDPVLLNFVAMFAPPQAVGVTKPVGPQAHITFDAQPTLDRSRVPESPPPRN
jgi:hypothetical protein